MPGLMDGVRVLDLGQRISAPYCARTFANMGAEVIKVEPPDGDEARRMGPFPDGSTDLETSGVFLALNVNKFGTSIDLTSDEGAQTLKTLVKSADILVENYPLGYLDGLGLGYETLREINPSIIHTSITPFGNWGPNKDWKANDLTIYQMSGNAHGLLGAVEDPYNDPPIRAGGHQSEFVAGVAATTATLMALFRKRMAGEGSHVEISAYEAMVTQIISGLASSAYGRPAAPRDLKQVREASIAGMIGAIGGVLPCTDGYVAISPREDAQWARWLEVMSNPPWATDERFVTREARQGHSQELWQLLADWTSQLSKHEVARMGQERRIPCFPVNTVADLLDDGHLAEREFFVEFDHAVAGTMKYPGVAYRFSNSPLPLDSRPAPLLGEHNDQIIEALEQS